MLVGSQPQHFQRYVLEGAQQLSTVLQHQRTVRAGKFHQDFGVLPFAIAGHWRIHRDLVAQVEISVSDDSVQELANLLGGGDFIGNRHSSYLLALPIKSSPPRRLASS